MSLGLWAANRAARSAGVMGRAFAPQPGSLVDGLIGVVLAVAVVGIGVPCLLGRWLGSLVGLDLDWLAAWIVGAIVVGALLSWLIRALLAFERRERERR